MMPCQQALKPSLLARELLPVPQTHPWRGQEFRHEGCCCCQVTSVVSDSVRPQRRHPTRLPHPWDSPGKNTGVGCHFLLQCMKVKSESEVAQSCLTLSNPVDCSLPGSSIHGIFQARVLKWGAIAVSLHGPAIKPFSAPNSKGSVWPYYLPGTQTFIKGMKYF